MIEIKREKAVTNAMAGAALAVSISHDPRHLFFKNVLCIENHWKYSPIRNCTSWRKKKSAKISRKT